MANNDNDSSQSQADPQEADVTSGEGGDQESTTQTSTDDAAALTLEELEKVTGKTFKSKEKALKSLDDTTNYVGDLGSKVAKYEEKYGPLEDQESEGDDNSSDSSTEDDDVMTKAEYRREKWFDENPKYKEHREVIEALSERHDAEPQEVVEMDGVKSLFEGQSGQNDQESVAMSNNRVGQSSDTLDEANEAMQQANDAVVKGDVNTANRKRREAQEKALKSVVDVAEPDNR